MGGTRFRVLTRGLVVRGQEEVSSGKGAFGF
jgi:hypothetical protein